MLNPMDDSHYPKRRKHMTKTTIESGQKYWRITNTQTQESEEALPWMPREDAEEEIKRMYGPFATLFELQEDTLPGPFPGG